MEDDGFSRTLLCDGLEKARNREESSSRLPLRDALIP
jgi:hypothetical protein